MTQNKYEIRLQKCYNTLYKIEQHIHQRSDRYLRRSTPVFISTQFTFQQPAMAFVDKTFTNASDDCWLTEMSYGVIRNNYTTKSKPRPLHLSETGFMEPNAISPQQNIQVFDFAWDWKVNSTDRWYRSNVQGTPDSLNGCISTSMGFTGRNNRLILSAPLFFASGDSITVRIYPLNYGTAFTGSEIGGPGPVNVEIIVSAAGFRTEEMYDPTIA